MEKPNILRKSVVSFALVILSFATYSQNWIDVGLKGGYGLTMFYNQNIFEDQTYNHQLSGGYTFGGKFGFNMGEKHEITFDVMSSGFKQKFKFNVADSLSSANPEYNTEITNRTLDLMLMYRNNNEGRYFEIGPVLSIIRSAKQSDSFFNYSNADVKNHWEKNGYGLAMGFGAYMFGTENFGITFGARFSYMISDAISQVGQANNFPTGNTYSTYKASHPFSAMVVMELNYDLGYMAQASCSKRRKIILF